MPVVALPYGLIHLDISACKLKEIQRGFLRNFSNLEYLDISYNWELSLEVLPNVTFDLQFTNIKVLKLDAIQCRYGKGLTLKRIYSQYLTNTTSLEEVSLSSNRIETIERFVISSMPDSIQRITAANNRLIFSWAMLEISYLKNLKYGDISRQSGASSSFLSLLANDCNDSKSYKQEDKDRLSYPYQLQSATKQKGKIESCLSEFITIPPRKHINIYICLPKSLQKILIHHNGLGQEEGIHHDGIGQEEGIPISNNMLFDFRHVKYINAKGNMFRSLLNSGFSFRQNVICP